MKTFIKTNIASVFASFLDYLLTITLVQVFYADKVWAGIAGTVFGGIINFSLNRHWVFKTVRTNLNLQRKRYFITWSGNLIFNAAGLYCLINLINVQYMVAKIITSLIVALFYNYPLQKRYVFKISD